MKKLITIIGMLLTTIVIVNAQNKETRGLGSFDEVKVSQSINLILIPSNKNEATIETRGVDVDRVETDINGGTLHIRMARGTYRSTTVDVTLNFKELGGIFVNSSATATSREAIRAEELFVDVSSSGKVDLDIVVDKLKVEVSSSGRIELSGKATSQVIKASSSGRYLAYGVESEGVKVDVSSSARVEVSTNKEIYADASSSGKISYRGKPDKVIANTSSSGNVSGAN